MRRLGIDWLSILFAVLGCIGMLAALGELKTHAAGISDGTSAGFAIPLAAPHEVKLPDPWGQVGQEISIRAVEVGGLECAVMVSGVERRTSLWCRAK